MCDSLGDIGGHVIAKSVEVQRIIELNDPDTCGSLPRDAEQLAFRTAVARTGQARSGNGELVRSSNFLE
jgi:hypothetical protein